MPSFGPSLDSPGGGDTVAALLSLDPPLLAPALLSVLLLLGTAAAWYIAAHAAAAALPNRAAAFILAGGMPGLAGVVWFTLTARAEAALALALGTAVAAVTLVMGLVSSADPTEGRRVLDDPSRRLKATLLPASVTLLVAGFAGALTVLHSALLLLAGAVVAWLGFWASRSVPTASLADVSQPSALPTPGGATAPLWLRTVFVILAGALATSGAGLAAASATAASRRQGMELDAAFATLLVSAVLALPLIGIGTQFAGQGQGLIAQRGLTLLAVLMLCLAVPAVVLLNACQEVIAARAAGEGWRSFLLQPPVIPMPSRFWRTDSVMLCLAGLLLLPSAAGRYRLGRIEGIGLILLYIAYLLITLVAAR